MIATLIQVVCLFSNTSPLHALPEGWRDMGRSVQLSAAGDVGANLIRHLSSGDVVKVAGVDEDGSYVYFDYGVGVNTGTGKTRTIRAFQQADKAGRWFLLYRWEDHPELTQVHIYDMFFVHGDRFGLSVGGSSLGPTGFSYGVADGPAVPVEWYRDGERHIRSAGFDVQLGPKPGVERVTHGKRIVEIPLPAGLHQFAVAQNTKPWRSGHLYATAYGPKITGLLVISFKGDRPIFENYPLPKALGLDGAWFKELSSVLADESACISVAVSQYSSKMPKVSWKYATFTLRRGQRKWQLWPDLIVYGTSYNGRFVAYGWGSEPVLRIAKVEP